MSKLYINEDQFNRVTEAAGVHSDFNLKCVGRQINNGIRRYSLWFPRTNSSVYYNVYYYEYDDLLNDYTLFWDSEQRSLPTSCLADVEMTTDVYYRKDIMSILICFLIIVLICIYFPYKILARLFGRWLKI